MRRKVLQDHANTFCQMFVGWRMVANDAQTLARLGAGPLRIDVLTGETWHRDDPVRPLYIAEELKLWFEHQLADHAVPRDLLRAAELLVEFDSTSRPTRRGRHHVFPVTCRSAIITAERTYSSVLTENVHVEYVVSGQDDR